MSAQLSEITDLIREKADIVTIIEEIGIGEFPASNHSQKFRGSHGTHGSSSQNHCEIDPKNGYWRCFSCGQGGSVIDWVLSTKYAGNFSLFPDAVQWLATFLGLEVGNTPIDTPKYQAYRILTEVAHEWNQLLLSSPKELAWVKEKWGLNEDTIRDLCIGYAGELPTTYTSSELGTTGLVTSNRDCGLYGRITFPHFYGGQVRWMAGRFVGDPPDNVPKYVGLLTTSYVRPVLYNFDSAMGRRYEDELYVAEGLGDAALAAQNGLRVVALGTTTLRRESIPDMVRLFKACDLQFIVLDSEINGAGLRGAKSVAQTMINLGFDPELVELPRAGRPKIDLCDYLMEHGYNSFVNMIRNGWQIGDILRTSETLAQMEIRECPARPVVDRYLQIIQAFAPLQDVLAQRYLKLLHDKTKAPMKDLQKLLTSVRKKGEKIEREIDLDYETPPFYAQDYTYHPDIDVWRGHMTVHVPIKESIERGGETFNSSRIVPVYVTVDQTKGGSWYITKSEYLLDVDEATQEMLPSDTVLDSIETKSYAWSFVRQNPYSVTNFIDKHCRGVDTSEIYNRVYALFDRYVYYPDEREKHLLSLFVFFTYIFMGFEAAPYLHANGPKNSGKSTTLNLLSSLCFNVISTSSITAASGFRLIHPNRPTLIIDEGERLRAPQPGSNDAELLSVAMGGYQKSPMAKAIRMNMESMKAQSYFTYCPKVFGSINMLAAALKSRNLLIHCQSAPANIVAKLGNLDQDSIWLAREYQELRDMLHIWGLTEFRAVRDRFDSFKPGENANVINRSADLWWPLFAIAELVDAVGGTNISKIVQELAVDKAQQEKNHDDKDFTSLVLRALYNVHRDDPSKLHIRESHGKTYLPISYAVRAIITRLQEDQEWTQKNSLTSAVLSKFLRDIGAVSSNDKSVCYRVHGEQNIRVAHINFSIPRFVEAVQMKGLVADESIG